MRSSDLAWFGLRAAPFTKEIADDDLPERAGGEDSDAVAVAQRAVGAVPRVRRQRLKTAERRLLICNAERKKPHAYPPLAPGKKLVPIVIDDLGGIGAAALRKIATEGERNSGYRGGAGPAARAVAAGVP